MTSKKALDDMYNIAISNSGDFEKADKVRECYNKIADDLEVLEIFKNKFCIKTQKALFNKRPMYIINIMGHDIFIPKVIYDKLKQWLEGED